MKIIPLISIILSVLLFVPSTFAEFDREAFEIFELVNQQRAAKKIKALEWDDDLANLAQEYSKQMAKENFFSHTDKKGLGIVERAENKDIKDYLKISENLFLFRGYEGFTYTAVDRWMRSAEHKRNILDPEFQFTGIGIAETNDSAVYITQVFLTRE